MKPRCSTHIKVGRKWLMNTTQLVNSVQCNVISLIGLFILFLRETIPQMEKFVLDLVNERVRQECLGLETVSSSWRRKRDESDDYMFIILTPVVFQLASM